jgi:N,N'-diacetylchitobiose transport system substrate-binding protein
MRKRHFVAAGALGLAAMLALSACSSGTSGSSSSSSEKGKTLTVWLMQSTLTPASQKAITKKFDDETGAKVKIEIQQWDNINTKMTTALATDTPPDVVEIGNTDVPLFAANGALADITKDKKKLSGGGTWLTGLEGPATVNGKLYAAPFYAGARGVIYNKQLWSAAGITAPPTTYDEFTADLDKVAAQNTAPDFSPIYVTGTYWYGGFTFVTDAGGSIATEKGGTWTSGLTSAAAQKGLGQFKDFQNKYSTVASRTAPLDTPDPNAIFGTGKTSAIMGNGNSLATIASSYPALKGQLGSFAIPSENHPGENAPTYLGGSDIAIAAKSKNQELALDFLKLVSSSSVQLNQLTTLDGHIPVTNQLINKALPTVAPELKAFFTAAKKSYSTPATPGWATIESDQTVLSFFSEVAAGTTSVSDSATSFSKHLTSALNGNK